MSPSCIKSRQQKQERPCCYIATEKGLEENGKGCPDCAPKNQLLELKKEFVEISRLTIVLICFMRRTANF